MPGFDSVQELMALNIAVLMFGPPGSGKGTQAVLLADCFGLCHISTGDILREHVAAGDELGREVDATLKAGKLVSDDLVNRIVAERVERPDCAGGFILDGYPRTLAQAGALAGALEARRLTPVVVDLVVDYNVIVTRIAARRQCPLCGASYNLVSNPPRNDEICDRDGAHLATRADDRPEVVWKRLEAYEQQTRPLLDYFRQAGWRFLESDGNAGSPDFIAKRICQSIRNGLRRETVA